MHRGTKRAAPALLVLLALAGCGGTDNGGNNGRDGGGQRGSRGSSAQLGFYDWEPSVIGNPDKAIAGFAAAVKAAEKAEGKGTGSGAPSYYLLGADGRRIAGPAESCGDLLGRYGKNTGTSNPPSGTTDSAAKGGACRDELKKLDTAGPPAGSQVRVVPRGLTIVKAQPKPGTSAHSYFVIRDHPELSGADVESAKQSIDPLTHKPIVVLQLTPRGGAAFARVTKREAQRGAAATVPGASPEASLQHFAITVNGQIVSLATIDFRQNPDGINARNGIQISGLTIAQARRLAAQLR